jgi:mono/diheme cytochrome c family protein
VKSTFSPFALAGALLLAGCGGGEQGGQAQGQQQAAAAQPAPAAATDGAASGEAQGRAVYNRTCATCHQMNGRGIPGTFPPIEGSHIIAGDKTTLIRLVLNGLQGPITIEGRTYNGIMPPWKSLSDAEMSAVLTYVRVTYGGGASAVTAEEVARERAATASRTTPFTAAELGL